MAVDVEAVEDRIRAWSTSHNVAALPPEEIWAMMDDVIDDVMDEFDPWFSFSFGVSERDHNRHMNDSQFMPPARYNGALVNDEDIVDESVVPNNQEFLRAVVIPAGLLRPVDVYAGELYEGRELTWIGYDEFKQTYGFTNGFTTDWPTHYTIYGGTFLLGPTPPFDIKIQAFGVYRPTRIVSGGDVNPFVTENDRLLLFGVLNKLVLYNFEEGTRGPVFEREFKKAKDKLLSRTRLSNIRAHRIKSRRAGTLRSD